MQHQRTTSAILLAGLVALGAGPVIAAGESESQAAEDSAEPSQPARISDAKLEQFTLALSDVRDVRMEYGPKLQQAESQEQRMNVKKEGRQAMMQAIHDNGLEVQEYNRIGNRLGNDKELQKRVRDMLASQQG